MSDLARQPNIDPASIEGLDDLLDCTSSEAPATEGGAITSTSAEPVTRSANNEPPSGWTLREAADNLGISLNTVRKRLRDGTLRGEKVLGINGPEWCITPPTDTGSNEAGSKKTPSIERPSGSSIVEPPSTVFSEMFDELRATREELQAAHWRNGYLEAQLESHKEQIKLLPDYQHKATEAEILKARVLELETELQQHRQGGWRQFWSWFTGR